MTSKKSKPVEPIPEFDIDDTPITSDGECPCVAAQKRVISCHLHGGVTNATSLASLALA
jgi:hypothetical protein